MEANDPNFEKLVELDKNSLTFKKLRDIVVNTIVARMNGEPDPTQGATHYHTYEVDPHWNRNAKSMIRLGNHQFWTEVDS
jgi:N-acetylmuramoyl-L-alanine amidase